MTMNLRSDDKFVEDEGWLDAYRRYTEFTAAHECGNVVYLELGVGYNTPVIIKYPFWKMTAKNPDSTYICINAEEGAVPDEIKNQSIVLDCDIHQVLCDLSEHKRENE